MPCVKHERVSALRARTEENKTVSPVVKRRDTSLQAATQQGWRALPRCCTAGIPGSARIWGRRPEAQGCRSDRPRVDSLFARSPARTTATTAGAQQRLRKCLFRMRPDMHKVVVERPRHGSRQKNRKWGQRLPVVPESNYEDQPKFVSSGRKRQYGNAGKWLSDVLGPLEGFLHNNVGRPWNKVYSELRQGLDARKVTGQHIFDHLEMMVETNCWIGADRNVYSYGWRYRVNGFYVHPKSGLLCFQQRQSARQREKERLLRQ